MRVWVFVRLNNSTRHAGPESPERVHLQCFNFCVLSQAFAVVRVFFFCGGNELDDVINIVCYCCC